MEYTDYYVARGPASEVANKLKPIASKALLMDEQADFIPFVRMGDDTMLFNAFPWLLSVFDAEGGAWGFVLMIDAKEVARGTYGENSEWGIDRKMNGFEGDLDAAADGLDTTTAELEACFTDDGVEKFCKLVGFDHAYMLYPHESQMPDGVSLLSDFG